MSLQATSFSPSPVNTSESTTARESTPAAQRQLNVALIDTFDSSTTEPSHGDVISASIRNGVFSREPRIDALSIDTRNGASAVSGLLRTLQTLAKSETPPDVVNIALEEGFSSGLDEALEKLFTEKPRYRLYMGSEAVRNTLCPEELTRFKEDVQNTLSAANSIFEAFDATVGRKLRFQLSQLVSRGSTVVIAAGNNGVQQSWYAARSQALSQLGIEMPATPFQHVFHNGTLPAGVIVVGGSEDGIAQKGCNAADFSTRSSFVDVSADATQLRVPGFSRPQGGTGMAAAAVSALVVDLKSVNPYLTPGQIENIIKSTAQRTPQESEALGAGIISPEAAFGKAFELLEKRRIAENTEANQRLGDAHNRC